MVARRANEPAKGTLDLPGGFVDLDEDGETAMCREIAEETGLAVTPADLRYLFSNGNAADMPTYEITEADIATGSVDILTLLHVSGLVPSKSEARRAVQQGGVSVDGERITDIKKTFSPDVFDGDGVVLKKGKKNFRKVRKH